MELFVRHAPPDEARARQLLRALEAFGYAVGQGSALPERYSGPILYLWSPAALLEDEINWEAATLARDRDGAPRRVFVVVTSPIRSRISINAQIYDLSVWDGDPADDRLCDLLMAMPAPATPAQSPPFKMPSTYDEARWRTQLAQGNLYELISIFKGHLRANPPRTGLFIKGLKSDIRRCALEPSRWRQFGDSAFTAAKEGPDGLFAYAVKLKEKELIDDQAREKWFIDKRELLSLIQIVLGPTYSVCSLAWDCSPDEVSELLEQGEQSAFEQFEYGHLSEDQERIVRRYAKAGNPAAQVALAGQWRTQPLEKRILLERAAAQNYHPALHHLGRFFSAQAGHRRKAVEAWRKGAALGNRLCQQELAQELDKGRRRDPSAAFNLYKELYDRNSLNGAEQVRIGQMLWDGDGVKQDRKSAVEWFFRCHIENGCAEADIHIGDLYRDGLGGLAKDLDEAISWYRVSFEANNEAINAVACVRLRGLGVTLEEFMLNGDADDPELLRDQEEEASRFWRPTP